MTSSEVVVCLNYYTPYVSGLTNYARDVAEGLIERGHSVTVVTTQHSPELATEEILNGVKVLRAPVLATIGKGVVSPAYVMLARSAMRSATVLHLHLPMLEAGLLAKLSPAPVVVTYHCDVSLPPGPVGWVQQRSIDASSRSAIGHASAVVVTSEDYARHSRLQDVIIPKMIAIPPPCLSRPTGKAVFRDGPGFHVGSLGRIVEEKGLEYLIDGFKALSDPNARLLLAGDYKNVVGGSVVGKIVARIDDDPRITVLGFLGDDQIADLYASLDAFALPSINSFEAFGIVQVEAMLAGVPVLASDLPGVRVPVRDTGFGVVVPARSSDAVRAGLSNLRDAPPDRALGAATSRSLFSIDPVLDAYEKLVSRVERDGRVSLEDVSKHWTELGEIDPLWAVLTEPEKSRHRWDVAEFLASGNDEITSLFETLRGFGVTPDMEIALDFGCGAGRLTHGLVESGFAHAIGVDISQPMLHTAREISRHGDRIEFVHNATPTLKSIETASIDMVYSCRVLQHMPWHLSHGYIREFFRVARPSGVVVFQIPVEPAPGLMGTLLKVTPNAVLNRLRKGMEMHGTPLRKACELIGDSGGQVIHVLDDTAAGPRWLSHTYICCRRAVPR